MTFYVGPVGGEEAWHGAVRTALRLGGTDDLVVEELRGRTYGAIGR